MLIYTNRPGFSPAPQFPYAVLETDGWDDFGFKTLFTLTLQLSAVQRVDVGQVKILQYGQTEGRVAVPDQFENLGDDFISLGQSHEYYEKLRLLDSSIFQPLLDGLSDAVVHPELVDRFAEEPGFETSLRRFGSAVVAMETAPSLFGLSSAPDATDVSLRVRTQVGGSPFEINFEWDRSAELPGRIAAVIGYNGTGKTQLLANLPFIVAETGLSASGASSHDRGEVLDPAVASFAGVMSVSYSAFDTFALPAQSEEDQARVTATGSYFGYSYLGLRKAVSLTNVPADEFELKSPNELSDEFERALRRVRELERVDTLFEMLTTLLQEPSFARSGLTAEMDELLSGYRHMSTGHKLVLNVAVHLAGQLQPRTLLLMDEPESHLHPPLVAALLKIVSVALQRHDSLAIVATHSPVVLQEVPSRHVRVLRRLGSQTIVDRPEIETYGENIGRLTRTAFNLDSSATDFQGVLQRLSQQYTLEQIEAMFNEGLSDQARALVVSFRRSNDAQD